ncbi:MAG: SDR family oxidoreductase [Deltaproteobacteria bacterium]|nr:SDR family oxidoreductase [Deltaproteobacteria bacterium]
MVVREAVAVVTGGARRLGQATVLRLAQAGCHVVVNYHHSEQAAADTAADARAFSVQAESFQADVSRPAQAQALIDFTLSRFGRLDLLVANAGVFRRTPIAQAGDGDWDDMMRGNLDAFFFPAQSAGAAMVARGGGAIVALADVAGLRPWAEYGPYCAAKAAVAGLVQALAIELAPLVRVNGIAPGPVLFPDDFDAAQRQREIARTLLGRAGGAGDIAEAVLFLARADYITGVVLPVDGGRLLFEGSR